MKSSGDCKFSGIGNGDNSIRIEEKKIFVITIKGQEIEMSSDELDELKRLLNTITL